MKDIKFETKPVGNRVQVTAIYKDTRLSMEGYDEVQIKEDLAKDITERAMNKGISE